MSKNKQSIKAIKKKARQEAQIGASPLPMTQIEVDALRKGDVDMEKSFSIRLRTAVPSDAPLSAKISEISGGKAAPPRITVAEMAEIKQLGHLPEKLLNRFARSVVRQEELIEAQIEKSYKAQPEQHP